MKEQIMKEQIYQDVKNALQQLADALGVASEHLWTILVKQQIVEAWIGILPILIFIFSVPFLKVFFNKMDSDKIDIINQSDDKYEDYKASNVFIFLLSIAFTFVALCLSIGHIQDVFTGFINPEYGAFQEIKEILK